MVANAARTPIVTRVGLISDTHGWLDPRAEQTFAREDRLFRIVHAGDVGAGPDVLYGLGAVAPVTAVLGNCDYRIPGFDLGAVARVRVAETTIVVIHNAGYLDPALEPFDVLVHGHTHRPSVDCDDNGVLIVNPGSASQRRSQPSCSVGVLDIADDGGLSVRIIYLDDVGPRLR